MFLHINKKINKLPNLSVFSVSKIFFNTTLPVVEFSVSICSTPKFFCSSDDGVPRILITENDASYKSNINKNKMMWMLFQLKIEFIIINSLKGK